MRFVYGFSMSFTRTLVRNVCNKLPLVKVHTFYQYTNNILTNKNGLNLHCHYWETSSQPKALVLLMHGYAEHLQWYHHVGVSLAQEGCLAFGHDHVGHGRSEGLRVMVDDITDLVDDALLHVNKMREHYPDIPVFMMGHSMGGLIALLSSVREPNIFKGVVFNGPFVMLGAETRSPFKKWCARTFCKFLPNAQVGKISMENVTGDQEMIKKISSDPNWWQGGIKLKTGAAFLNAVEKVSEQFEKLDFPFLIIHGQEDKICDLEGSQNMMKMAPSKDKIIKIYPGAEHHLYLDKQNVRDMAVKDTVEWICQRIGNQ